MLFGGDALVSPEAGVGLRPGGHPSARHGARQLLLQSERNSNLQNSALHKKNLIREFVAPTRHKTSKLVRAAIKSVEIQ